jgi:hypothetical protein
MDPVWLAAIVIGGVVLLGVCVLVLVLVLTRRRGQSSAFVVQPGQPLAAPSLNLPPAQAWQLAAQSLAEFHMSQLDAETYTLRVGDSGKTLYLKMHPRDATLRGWLDRPAPGGALDRNPGVEIALGPRDGGRSDLARWLATTVHETLGALPRGARLTVKTPEIPGDSYKANLETPFASPEQPALVVQTLLAVDQAAQRPAEGGSPTHLPPAVQCWMAAAPALTALGMTKLDAETYMLRVGTFGQTVYVKLEVSDGGVRGWLDKPCPGGTLEQHLNAEASVRPGDAGHSPIARWVVGAVREVLGGLPHKAQLTVNAPEIPGDKYKASLSTPLTVPDHAALVARVLLALDQAAQQPAVGGAPVHLPPVVMCWQAAAPSLQAMGMTAISAEAYMRHLSGVAQSLYLAIEVRDGTIRGWFERPFPGGVLERYLRTEVTLQPGEQGRSELAAWLAGSLREILGALPRGARLTVKAPEIPGDSVKASLTTPFTSPDQASTVVRVLLALEQAAQQG